MKAVVSTIKQTVSSLPVNLSAYHSAGRQVFFGAIMKRIPLTQGKCAIVDDDDYKTLSQYKWYALHDIQAEHWTAVRMNKDKPKRRTIYMHRQIINTPLGMETDHINHNGLDNRKCNLRVCTRAENMQNRRPERNCTSVFKGVTWQKGKWKAQIICNKKHYYLGCFENELDAAHAYIEKAKQLHGAFACFQSPLGLT